MKTMLCCTNNQFINIRAIKVDGNLANEMALLSIEWVYTVKECTPARSC